MAQYGMSRQELIKSIKNAMKFNAEKQIEPHITALNDFLNKSFDETEILNDKGEKEPLNRIERQEIRGGVRYLLKQLANRI